MDDGERELADLYAHPRETFPAFYAAATLDYVAKFDELYLAWRILMQSIDLPRTGARAAPHRHAIERLCNDAEHHFTKCRETVKECPTFMSLPPPERKGIVGVVLLPYC